MNKSSVDVKPLTVHTGAEISGVDLTKPLAEEAVRAIRDALLKWRVVFFREQYLDHEQHIAFARHFGEPTAGHVVFGSASEFPEIYPVSKHRKAFAARPAAQRPWTDWHTDITAAINPPFASILRGDIVPEYGGDTQWTNMVAAYEGLSAPMQDFLSTLRSRHQFMVAESGENAADYNKMVNQRALISEHPLVTVHPETNERALYTSSEFVQGIVGLEQSEAEAILHLLWEHCIRPEYSVRFRWEPGSIAFWDNRSTQHLAIRDVYQTDFDRQFYRVTLNGQVPMDVFGKPSTSISGSPILPQK